MCLAEEVSQCKVFPETLASWFKQPLPLQEGVPVQEAVPDPAFREYITAATHTTDLRIIRPGQELTSDVRSNRINVQIDRSFKITAIWCDRSSERLGQ
jgi:Peptidase inhibitor I78 family